MINSLQKQHSHEPFLVRLGLWIHEHPTIVKVIKIAGLISGLALMAIPPFFFKAAVITLSEISGALITVISLIAIVMLDIIVPPHHDMKNHMYEPKKCAGGKLYYEGDVPIVSIKSDDPYSAGKALGYLTGDAINRLSQQFSFVMHTLLGKPRADKLGSSLAEIKKAIPECYLKEMEGVVEGYKDWISEQYWWQFPKKLSVDDVLLFHLIPDSLHFQPTPFGCSAIVINDPQKGPVIARNMDWPSFGLAGAYSLVIRRKNTLEVGLPGFVGTVTGMNRSGLSLAMNVCSGSTHQIRGMPASLYNRACLEKCQTAVDVEKFVLENHPLGPYHMTVADKDTAEAIHFYQGKGKKHVIRYLKDGNPLSTLNCHYTPEPSGNLHNSMERQAEIDQFFKANDRPIEDVLSLPFVNNWITTHRVLMEPRTKIFKVAFDNAFAGRAPLHQVSTKF